MPNVAQHSRARYFFSEKSPRKFAAFGPSALAFDKSGSFVALVMQSRLIFLTDFHRLNRFLLQLTVLIASGKRSSIK